MVHPHRHLRPGLRRQRYLAIDPGGPAPSVALRHLPHADQRVRPGPQHHLLQRPDLAQSCSRVALKILRRSRPTLPSWTRQSMASQSGHVLRSVHRHGVQLALRFGRLDQHQSFKGSPAHVSALSGPATRAGIRPVIPRRPTEGPTMSPRFPVAFRPPAFASWASCSRRGIPPPSRSAYQARRLDPDGVSTFRTCETRPEWAPSLPRGQRCSHGRSDPSGRRSPPLQRPGPITPVFLPSPGALYYEASSRVHLRSPARPSPRLLLPGWNGDPWASPRASHPSRQDLRRTPGRGRASSTRPELHVRHHRPPIHALTRDVRPRVARPAPTWFFASAGHLASWIGVCPGHERIGGRARPPGPARATGTWPRASRMRLGQRAHQDPARRPVRRLARRFGKGTEKKAAVAVARTLICIAWTVLSPRTGLRRRQARTTTSSGTAATASTSAATTGRPWPGSATRSP